ncbi:MAG: glycine cleavage system protein GcvH [Candidatus Cyclonatronum sp.]|uniref:glycine cleavage system protein GcvH n=1 Tax=Cyclonatronum sp. TaxID=3024185 RepID=UPI0025C3DAA7|nr:glycine cleavage system protein GcvH [Cyclonatronum sp.]MCC5933254.1 glycine cleavage system protein GcvH [Balneolales bacterium]MCH8485425.1 glycine cleavage system protein GcvH [Cyclonatronum sp.]
MGYPTDLKYTKEHEWVRNNGDGTATVGITEFAQSELGDIVFVELNDTGETYDQDEVFGTIEAVKTVSDLFMPVSGEVAEHNEALADNPEIVNEEPYEGGWLIKIRMSDESELDDLMDADAYQEIIA